MNAIVKYPRTPHITGSRLQPGDDDLVSTAKEALAGLPLVVEEKLDGSNCGISFDAEGDLVLQSRGHALTGGPRERQFDLFKRWASHHIVWLRETLGRRYVMFGEWLFARHTIVYDRLPHYFLEFDVLDREAGRFLSTAARASLLEGLAVHSVPVVASMTGPTRKALEALVEPSRYKSPAWRESLRTAAEGAGVDPDRCLRETDPHDLSEGL